MLWRGDLSTLGCEAALRMPGHDKSDTSRRQIGAASRPSGDKSPRHRMCLYSLMKQCALIPPTSV
ncbi:hypothetical protein C1C98_17325 [Pseudomonas ogarae]|uniref:Uncharacterized protein n=1 Tax=Pseudomonas ogarae (strain DSM 112162 / CECT 30235 / F113) TaxID=1114970 RepID=A0ABM6R0R0_PSEO1|nr:hypothetical protein C1C98_17325 [Pseudomonas ogarae]